MYSIKTRKQHRVGFGRYAQFALDSVCSFFSYLFMVVVVRGRIKDKESFGRNVSDMSSSVVSIRTSKTRVPSFMVVPVFALCCVIVFGVYRLIISMHDVNWASTLKPLSPLKLSEPITKPWEFKPIEVVMRTRVGIQGSNREPHISLAVVVVMHDRATPHETMLHISDLVRYVAPRTDLHIYTGVSREEHGSYLYNGLHNCTVPQGVSVELTVLYTPHTNTQKTRAFRFATLALSELVMHNPLGKTVPLKNAFLLVIHFSCSITRRYDVSTLETYGRGFLLLRTPFTEHELYDQITTHDIGVASGSLLARTYKPRGTVLSPFHCSGTMMHALHTNFIS
jgi:hypothetical protein